jgi:hypothetical protein
MLSFNVVVAAEYFLTKFCRFYRFDGNYIPYLYVTDGMKVAYYYIIKVEWLWGEGPFASISLF